MLKLLFANLSGSFGDQLRRAYEAKLDAENDADRLDAEREIARIEAAASIAVIEARERFSATSLGRYLIVIPYGIWWAAVFLDSTFNLPGDVLDIPTRFHEMAKVLIPAIIIADAGALSLRRLKS